MGITNDKPGLFCRLLWFLGLWVGSVLFLGAIAYVIRLAIL